MLKPLIDLNHSIKEMKNASNAKMLSKLKNRFLVLLLFFTVGFVFCY